MVQRNNSIVAPSVSSNIKGISVKVNRKAKALLRKMSRIIWKVITFIGKVFAGAFFFYFLAGLVPAMRDEAPHFYEIVDLFVHAFDEMCKFLISYFQ